MVVLTDLAEFTHLVTRVKIVPAVADDAALIEVERVRGRTLAEKLSMRVLSRTWQMLLKGIAEVGDAGRPLAAAEMVLVRIAYAADLPTPDEVIRTLDGKGADRRQPSEAAGGSSADASATQLSQITRSDRARTMSDGMSAPASSRSSIAPQAAADGSPEPLVISRFEELIALAVEKRDLGVKLALERDLRLARCEDGRLEVGLEQGASKTLVHDLARKFSQWTHRPWIVVVSQDAGQPTVKAQNEARKAELKTGVRADPLVQAVLARFPGAEIVDVRKAGAVMCGETTAPAADPEIAEAPADEGGIDEQSARMALPGRDDA